MEPQNLKTAHPGGGPRARATRPRSSRVPGEEEPPGPASPSRALLGPAPRPPQRRVCLPRPARPTPARGSSPRGPAGPRSPEGFSEAAARSLEPHGPPPAPGQTRVSPAVIGRALARAGPQCACALPPGAAGSEEDAEVDRPPGTARRRAAKPGADPRPRPRGPCRGAPKARATPVAETFSLCVFFGKREGKEQDISDHPQRSVFPP